MIITATIISIKLKPWVPRAGVDFASVFFTLTPRTIRLPTIQRVASL
jgi:hypothetical protein